MLIKDRDGGHYAPDFPSDFWPGASTPNGEERLRVEGARRWHVFPVMSDPAPAMKMFAIRCGAQRGYPSWDGEEVPPRALKFRQEANGRCPYIASGFVGARLKTVALDFYRVLSSPCF